MADWSERERAHLRYLSKILPRCQKEIEAIVIITENGIPLAHYANPGINIEYVSVAGAVIAGSITLKLGKFVNADVFLKDERHLLIKSINRNYLICLTRPRPKPRAVKLILETAP